MELKDANKEYLIKVTKEEVYETVLLRFCIFNGFEEYLNYLTEDEDEELDLKIRELKISKYNLLEHIKEGLSFITFHKNILRIIDLEEFIFWIKDLKNKDIEYIFEKYSGFFLPKNIKKDIEIVKDMVREGFTQIQNTLPEKEELIKLKEEGQLYEELEEESYLWPLDAFIFGIKDEYKPNDIETTKKEIESTIKDYIKEYLPRLMEYIEEQISEGISE